MFYVSNNTNITFNNSENNSDNNTNITFNNSNNNTYITKSMTVSLTRVSIKFLVPTYVSKYQQDSRSSSAIHSPDSYRL